MIKDEHINQVFMPGVKLDPRLNAVTSFEEALFERELILMVVPSHVFRDVLKNIRPYLCEGMSLISATKGIENDTLMIMSQVAENILSQEYMAKFACLDGPSFAKEVSKKLPPVWRGRASRPGDRAPTA